VSPNGSVVGKKKHKISLLKYSFIYRGCCGKVKSFFKKAYFFRKIHDRKQRIKAQSKSKVMLPLADISK